MFKFKLFLLCLLCLPVLLNAQVVINEICPANADIISDTKYFNFSAYVELHNKGNSGVNIGGFFLTDDKDVPNKWKIPNNTTIPAQGFVLVWCDDQSFGGGLHANFSLDSEGEEIWLLNTAQVIVDGFVFPRQYTNVAYGRVDDGDSFGYLTTPSPEGSNGTNTGAERLSNPNASLKSGRYSATQTLTLSHDDPETTIRFTLNGSEPTQFSPLFENAISITKTTTIKAKAFREGFIPSKTEVKTYFINEHEFTLPVISITTNEDYLWDNTIGIYADGTNGTTGNCMEQPRNWNRDWDRHAVVEFFDKSGDKQFDQAVDIRIGGACSRNNPQKSLVVKARDKYGKNTINEKLFSSKDATSYGGFILRNSGNDFWYTMFRDGLMQSLTIDQMDVDYLAYDPKIIYLNGEYWGIMNLREKIDADYFESNFNVDKDDLDLIEQQALEGSADAYNSYLASLQAMDLTSDEAFTFIEDNIDVQEYINYVTTEIYYCNTDWPGNNVKFWRQRSTNGKWRWVLWDLDFGFGLYDGMSYATHPTLEFATYASGQNWPNPAWSTLHLRLLLQNPTFRSKFISTFTTSLSTVFAPGRVKTFIDSLQNRIADEMPFHTARWFQDIPHWNTEVQRLRDFADQRNVYMQQHLAAFFNLTGKAVVETLVTPPNTGSVFLNGINTSGAGEISLFDNLSYSLTAQPAPGYKFKSWKILKRQSELIALVAPGSSWKYFDHGFSEPNWNSFDFDDSAWATGAAKLGYGEGNESTVIGFGGDTQNKHITSYFRKSFSVGDTAEFERLDGRVMFDDGIVIYLNGEEIFRENMPQGVIDNNTQALSASAENVFISFSVPKEKLKHGDNILAIEVHQVNATSSDLSFDLSLSGLKLAGEEEHLSNSPLIEGVTESDLFIEAEFEEIEFTPAEIIINEVSSVNHDIADEYGDYDDWVELYNAGSNAVDLAGFYVTDKPENKTKYQIKYGDEETTIQPGAYKIVWADEEPAEGNLHVNLKLSAEGEFFGLYRIGTDGQLLTLDEVTIPQQFAGTSFSRIPDLTGDFDFTSRQTPGNENEFEEPTAIEDDKRLSFSFAPNPGVGQYTVHTSSILKNISIISVTGQQVYCAEMWNDNDKFSLGACPPGIYVVQAIKNGELVTTRLVKLD